MMVRDPRLGGLEPPTDGLEILRPTRLRLKIRYCLALSVGVLTAICLSSVSRSCVRLPVSTQISRCLDCRRGSGVKRPNQAPDEARSRQVVNFYQRDASSVVFAADNRGVVSGSERAAQCTLFCICRR